MQTISITVRGLVQGVYYRQSTREKATELGINGNIRNLSDGSVLIRATGSKDQLDKLLEWCRQGPPHAVVLHVEIKEEVLQVYKGFLIVR